MFRLPMIVRSGLTFSHSFTWLVLFAGVAGLFNASAARATTLYVNASCGDDAKTGTNSNCADANGPKLTIQNAINAAIDTDEIEVAPGTYNEVIDFIGKAITLRSTAPTDPAVVAATIIDGTGLNSSVVKCVSGEGADTVLRGFTITSGTGSDCFTGRTCGGGMFNDNSSPTVSSCNFRGNEVTYYGGGMYNSSSSPTVIGCTFVRNSGSYGGGMCNDNSSPTVTDCTISGNTATKRGAGMFNGDNSSATLTNCTINNNAAELWGGGLFIGYNSSPTVTNCSFERNRAGRGAGMYSQDSGSSSLTNCSFSGNAANYLGGGMYNDSSRPTVTNCTFSGNTAIAYGGGLYNEASSPVVTNCIFWGNSDVGGYRRRAQIADDSGSHSEVTFSCMQDAFAHDGDVISGVGNIDTNPLFANATGPDGASGTGDEDLSLSPRSPCIDSADSSALPADVHDLDGDFDTDESIPLDLLGLERLFDDPCMFDLGIPRYLYVDVGLVDMGAIEYQGDMPGDPDGDGLMGCADNCPFHDTPDQADCDAYALGDYCALELGVSRDCNGNEIPDECDIASGASTDLESNGVPDECQRVYYVDDNASPGQDGLSWVTAFVFLQDALAKAWTGDEIHVAAGAYMPDQDKGGNVNPGDRTASFQLRTGLVIKGGYRGCPGGVCTGGDPGERDIELYETLLSGDLAGDDTKVVSSRELLDEPTRAENSYHVVSSFGTLKTAVLSGVTIADGNADSVPQHFNGGGMSNRDYSNPTVINCTFRGNTGASGAGMYNADSSSPTVSQCTFDGNAATISGGGMSNQYNSNSTVINCSFSENVAEYGGGMYNLLSRTTVANSSFIGNAAVGFGGGMYNVRGSPVVTNCIFASNSASSGGGLHNSVADATVANCMFVGNVAILGAGMGINGYSRPRVTSCTFSGNTASANGGGIFNDGGQPALRNCVLWGDQPNEILNDVPGSFSGVGYCDVEGGLPVGAFDGGGNLDVDPLFVRNPDDGGDGWGDDPDTPEIDEGDNDDFGDLRLRSESLCINAGDPAFVPEPGETDLDGHSRVLCGRVDMGAYEFGIGDYDCSDVVDLPDFSAWSACMTGPDGGPYGTGCEAFDFDGDLDVDQQDYAGFAAVLPVP